MPNDLTINKKYLLVSLLLVVAGIAGVVTIPMPYGDFFTPVLGGLGLYLLIGSQQLKEIFQPMKKPYWLKLIGFFLLSKLIAIVISWIGIAVGQLSTKNSTMDQGVVDMMKGDLPFRLIKLFSAVFEIVGEELVMAIVTLSIFYFIKNKKQGWLIASLLGCVAFSFMHLWAYHFQIWICLSVGFSRLPFNLAWQKTDSIRSAIYIHLFTDLVIMIPLVLWPHLG